MPFCALNMCVVPKTLTEHLIFGKLIAVYKSDIMISRIIAIHGNILTSSAFP